MELVETKQVTPLPSEQGSVVAETELSQSMLSVRSRSVHEIAHDDDVQSVPESQANVAPGNPLHMELPEDGRSTPVRVTMIDDEDRTPSVTSLKNFHKLQHGRQRKNRNKIAPTDPTELDRPSSAPTTNRTRQWLKEINENPRPMTAAPKLSRQFVPPKSEIVSTTEQDSVDKQSLKSDKVVEDTVSITSSQKQDNREVESIQPAVNETAYIPYEYARAMISRIVGDMSKMKGNHLSIMTRMEDEYQKMEQHTQVQFNESITHLQDRQRKKVEHYRHIIELLHAELQSKGSLRNEVIQNLRERNKELAQERKKIQQQMSRSHLQFVPVPTERPQSAKRRDSEGETPKPKEKEEKVIEDTKETEKFPAGAVAVAAVAVLGEDEQASDREEEIKETLSDKEGEDVRSDDERKLKGVEKKDEESDHDEVVAEVVSDSEEEAVEDAAELVQDVAAVALVQEASDVPQKEKERKLSEVQKPSPQKKKTKPKVTAVPKAAESSADQAQQNKQQAIQATKQAKRIKELERQLESERKRTELSRKSAKNVDTELENSKNEVASLKKTLTEQKAELSRLEEAAGAGTIALQQLTGLQEQVKSLSTENETLVTNYNSERVLRKKYYNMVEDMKGKIRVYCRVRPLSRTEKGNKNKCAVFVPDEYTVKIEMNRGGVKEFQFDQIFGETNSQENIFEDTHSLIQSAVDGYNVCIFAYGQTGSGKTYTMIGDNDQKFPGIAPRAFDRIFDIVGKNKKKFTFKISQLPCFKMTPPSQSLTSNLIHVGFQRSNNPLHKSTWI